MWKMFADLPINQGFKQQKAIHGLLPTEIFDIANTFFRSKARMSYVHPGFAVSIYISG
ncbi:hypothetical protein Desmer_1893 [Desulfosporosinus meridiei DSM 13257]|uniref:Uncharacterized protein n=1 Tax=Desulfosporosinus meridiei (strain ATCC BAA-275 / DSM 13257 / KCTC 12902 / NCIMB 13706 / S10) TaxID=768704 RepID=J7IUM8_DESMD|nr:hypothetical protein Desmer_1893 [Desulfosporosinus meridiei DSM 13257]